MKKTLVLALAAVMVLGVAGAAFAGSNVFSDTVTAGTTDPAAVTVNAKVNSKITLTVATTEGSGTDLLLDWATTPLNPGDDPAAKDVTLEVKSNKPYLLNRDTTGMSALTTAGYTFAYSDLAPVSPAVAWDKTSGNTARTHTDSVDPGVIGYDITPDTLVTGSIVYSAVQQ